MTSSSSTERKLWLAVAVLQATIYLSLSLGDNVVRFLRENGMLTRAVTLVLLGCVAVIGWLLRRSNLGFRVWLVAGVMLAIYSIVLANVHRPEEKLHIVEYGIITGLVFEALRQRALPSRNLGRTFLISLSIGCGLGWVDEGIQYLLPDRVYEISDAVLNFGAALLAATSMALIHGTNQKQ